MENKIMLNGATALALSGLSVLVLSSTAQAAAISVGLELGLILDGSGSISNSEFQLQREGYQSALSSSNTALVNFLNGGGEFAVSVWQFASSVRQESASWVGADAQGWFLIDSVAKLDQFGNNFLSISKLGGSTDTAAVIDAAYQSAINNNFNGTQNTIDISTDGIPNSQSAALAASDDALAGGIDAINALGVGSGINSTFLSQLIGGTNGDGSAAFFEIAPSFAEFEDAITRKITREVTAPIPEPLTMMGVGTAFGFGTLFKKALARKQKKKV